MFDPNLFFDDNTTFTVLRNGEKLEITIPDNFINKMNSREAMSSFLKARTPFTIDSVYNNAFKAGLEKGDKIIKVDETFIVDLYELKTILEKNKSSIIQVTINRNETIIDKVVEISKDATIGIKVLAEPLTFSQRKL